MTLEHVSHTDLLIIGAGPSGLMAAAWASQYRVSARMIDKSSVRVDRGHADGLQCRTMEILDSFGLADQIRKEGFHDIEICSWDSSRDHGIQRTQRVLSQRVGVSRYPQAIIHQGYIEQTFLDFLTRNGGPHVERCVEPVKLSVDTALVDLQDKYPITVEIARQSRDEIANRSDGHMVQSDHVEKHNESINWYSSKDKSQTYLNGTAPLYDGLSGLERGLGNGGANGNTAERGATNGESNKPFDIEVIKAKYLFGCDGARSWTRHQLGIPLEGNQTQSVWGVIDIIPLSDFPDIRQTCVIRSASHGSILIAPREGKLVRLYVSLSDTNHQDNALTRKHITPTLILDAAKKIFQPYKLDFKYLDWWSVYKIQQRVASHFSVANRIFLAGDAIHTHSPKLGQGMNVSMQDTYNLGWKVCAVIKGMAKGNILNTYEDERRQVALDLIAIDRKIADYYSQAAVLDSSGRPDYQSLRDSLYEFLSGAAITYGANLLTLKPNAKSANGYTDLNAPEWSHRRALASKLVIGMRLPSYKVINQADARCIHFGEMLKSDGRWRIIVFAGDLTNTSQQQRVQQLGEALTAPTSSIHIYTSPDQPLDSVIEILTVHSSPRTSVNLLDLHEIFHPWDEMTGWDYWKVFADDTSPHDGFDDAYGKYGIDRGTGCMVVCRPDQHIGCICALGDVGVIEEYFRGILVARA